MENKYILALAVAFAVTVTVATHTTRGSSSAANVASRPAACQSAMIGRLPALAEASGLAVSTGDPNLLWSHNDSSDPILYGLGRNGDLRGRVRVTGASVDDWEALANARCGERSCLYIGDIGDNQGRRAAIRIYRVPEPAVSDTATAPAEVIQAVYPDGPQDAEAIFTAEGALYVVTKGEDKPVRVYRLAHAGTAKGDVTLQSVATLTSDAPEKPTRVTDASASADGRWVALRTAEKVLFFETSALAAGWTAEPLEADLRSLREPQGEGIAWASDNTLYLAGEGPGGGTLARMSCKLPA